MNTAPLKNPALSASSGDSGESIQALASLLKNRGLTISVAESCTGGLLASMLTELAGSSAYFVAGVVAYANPAKTAFLGVPPDLIERNGAVSAEVAAAMAEGILRKTGSDLALSITGIAGPDGGTTEKPVGTVYLGLADCNGSSAKLLQLSGSRNNIRILSATSAMEWAIHHLATAPNKLKR
ncbi:cinA-like protein [Geobacter sp. OR-1]|uniref:nicotinamide-nucleotide amidohydrolase family protein n=1 Tax=Geobacter sp. OR-1 TaxID=1266765 RepID=UPI000542893B|nr:cinA-like protein [Geobacter sp. OR-1]